jgi:hydroxymethylpyrimidine pyrophosphatase-like HAD family hydrolase
VIFASDLDHTLIYSERFLPEPSSFSLKQVEAGVAKSCMTQKAAQTLFQLSRALTFIPCTTRTIEQYKRIKFFKIEPEWAIVSNGANLLINNEVDQCHQKEIKRQLEDRCLNFTKILRQFAKLNPTTWTEPLRQADEVFYCIFDQEKIPLPEFEDFSAWAQEQNWNISLQGRKLYLVPNVIDKGAALARLAQMLEKEIIFAAGDSLLDISLLEAAQNSFVPIHGEIRRHFPDSGRWQYTKSGGVLAGEEILENILDVLTRGF